MPAWPTCWTGSGAAPNRSTPEARYSARVRLVVLLLLLVTAGHAPVAYAAPPGDDWGVKRNPFDPRVIGRLKAILEKNPEDRGALSRLVSLYRRHSSVGRLVAEYGARSRRGQERLPGRHGAGAPEPAAGRERGRAGRHGEGQPRQARFRVGAPGARRPVPGPWSRRRGARGVRRSRASRQWQVRQAHGTAGHGRPVHGSQRPRQRPQGVRKDARARARRRRPAARARRRAVAKRGCTRRHWPRTARPATWQRATRRRGCPS